MQIFQSCSHLLVMLPSLGSGASGGVALLEVYGSADRNCLHASLGIQGCHGADVRFVNRLDVYVPKRAGVKPVVLFVHGGVWASGDKWQFSPLGAFLAEEDVVAVLIQYTLFPGVSHFCSLFHIR